MPGEPYLILLGVGGFDKIGAQVYVRPMVSIIEILNFSSNPL